MSEFKTVAIKVIVLGNMNVGKTSLINSYFKGGYVENPPNTIGASLNCQVVPDRINKRNFHINVWDTCGMERYMSVNSSYCKDANVVILVIDGTDPSSLVVAEKYLEMVYNNCLGDPQVLLAISKVDLLPGFTEIGKIEDWAISGCSFYGNIQDFIERHKVDASFWVSPAMNGLNVSRIFEHIIDNLNLLESQTRLGGQRLSTTQLQSQLQPKAQPGGSSGESWSWRC